MVWMDVWQTFMITLLACFIWNSHAAPHRGRKSNGGKKKLTVHVARKSPDVKDPIIEVKPGSSGAERPHDFVRRPSIDFRVTVRKNKRTRIKKRKKREARINHNAALLSATPTNRRLYKLANKLGVYIRIHMNGTIDGTTNRNDPGTLFVMESHGPSILRIKGISSGRYITMNKKGVARAEISPPFFDSLFRLTNEENRWDTYASFKYYFEEKYDMLIGITKECTVKSPWKAAPGQHATQFLSLPYM